MRNKQPKMTVEVISTLRVIRMICPRSDMLSYQRHSSNSKHDHGKIAFDCHLVITGCHLVIIVVSCFDAVFTQQGGGPRVVVSTAAFHARVRGSVPGLGGLKETKLFLPHPRVKVSIVGSLRDREVACSASDRQGSNFESCVWRTVSSQSSHHPQEVLLAQFSLYVHKGGLKPDSFHFLPNKHGEVTQSFVYFYYSDMYKQIKSTI